MEGNLKIDISETNRGKEQIIIDRKFKYNFSKLKKDNTKIYRCTEYKTLNKCKSFIILNDNKEVLNYDSSHNHPGNEINASKSLIKHKIKDEIKKSLIPSDIKSKRIFDKISQEIGYICPEYKTIKSQITRYKNKQLFPNVKTFDEVPNVSEYYKTIRGEYFMIFKNSNIIIFQSPFQAKLFMENKHIFADDHITNNASESYNSYLKNLNLFVKKPSFYKLIYTIQFEESKSYYDYHMRIKGIWRKKSRISERVDDINILVEYYKNMEAELKNIGCSKNDIIENWFNCLIRLNNEIINFNKTK
ncbi:hypothetical protein LY90DRAFT_515068 [Neocallimastix californiae]|uniref:FLYWCH-type domain-containing protein n=1 Tax=Neocallimastix californiae TaxID=1754190 RepID=A0A1Y2AN78_9FUNG|nr:hypothetical protein LY90DRAFT_515068 [Neocallimastix californiae]|eukprot:ORY23405.1 hypothetical protein LY90DRAFT_515068 [Neocallimastix californiae]